MMRISENQHEKEAMDLSKNHLGVQNGSTKVDIILFY